MYGKTFSIILALIGATALSGIAGSAGNAEYVGAKKCKACHMKQYKEWQKTTMAASFENLRPGMKVEEKKKAGLDPDKNYTIDKNCLRCHTTQ